MLRVLCLVTRMIGDLYYFEGEEYVFSPEQAQKYADRGDFKILGPVPAAKMAEESDNKMRGAPRNKGRRDDAVGDRPGWRTADGKTVMLDGTPVEE